MTSRESRDRSRAPAVAGLRLRVDAVSGALAVVFGLCILWLGWEYPLGTTTHMGPGYTPRLLAGCCIALGLLLVLRGFREEAVAVDVDVRSLLSVLGAICVFAGFIEVAGLPIAAAAAVLLSSLARPGAHPATTVLLAVAIAALCAGLFVFGLGLPMRLLPWT